MPVLIAFALCACTALLTAQAEEPPPVSEPIPPPPPGRKLPPGRQAPMDERSLIFSKMAEASRELEQDPEIKKLKEQAEAASKAYRQALEAALEKKDPALLQQYRTMRETSLAKAKSTPKPQTGYDALSDEEKKRLGDARKKAMELPEVQKARQKRNASKTEAERKQAEQEYRQALREALVKTDKDIEALLQKIEERTEEPQKTSPEAK